jgi:hypothetical protein
VKLSEGLDARTRTEPGGDMSRYLVDRIAGERREKQDGNGDQRSGT